VAATERCWGPSRVLAGLETSSIRKAVRAQRVGGSPKMNLENPEGWWQPMKAL